MKKMVLALGLLLAGMAHPTHAADLKIAHVDSKLVFDKYADTKKAQKEYDKQVQKWEQDAATKQKSLMELKDKLEKQSLMLSEEKKKEMEADFLKKKSEYEQFVQQIYGKDGALFQKNEEFSGPIITKIKKTIQDVANQEGYDMVFDRAAGAVVFWKKDNDLTQKVIDVLNKEAK
ncbi:MAG: OmpH family outer membrane protein [Fibrobacteria bacterium]